MIVVLTLQFSCPFRAPRTGPLLPTLVCVLPRFLLVLSVEARLSACLVTQEHVSTIHCPIHAYSHLSLLCSSSYSHMSILSMTFVCDFVNTILLELVKHVQNRSGFGLYALFAARYLTAIFSAYPLLALSPTDSRSQVSCPPVMIHDRIRRIIHAIFMVAVSL